MRRYVPLILAGVMLVAAGCRTDALFRQRGPEGAIAPTAGQAEAYSGQEVDLVERLVAERDAYIGSLARLRSYYGNVGNAEKLARVEHEIDGLQSVLMFRYLMDAEVPSADLRPTESIAAADKAYMEAYGLMRRGGHGVPALYRQDLMVKALNVFKSMIAQYPTSDKIDDAAFYCGEIHKEYFPHQETIAVAWYERAFAWDPATPHPARFQAAVLYDYRLYDRARALELYRAVEREELANASNLHFATRRIGELTRARGPAAASAGGGRVLASTERRSPS
ncbi:MAG: hypothetical protein C4547_05785 [Phycisphaerales bacterium]|nr:MAG: hypothetical protein C4547_05785 [Phycisphaerales bacterium]